MQHLKGTHSVHAHCATLGKVNAQKSQEKKAKETQPCSGRCHYRHSQILVMLSKPSPEFFFFLNIHVAKHAHLKHTPEKCNSEVMHPFFQSNVVAAAQKALAAASCK